MKRIEDILMKRDGCSKREARSRIEECREAMYAAIDDGDEWEIEDIMDDFLGLEPDYIDELLW